jgi:hypothetical protein
VAAVSTRLLTVNLPRLLGDLVVGLVADKDDLVFVGDVSAEGAMAALDALAPDVIVVCMDETAPVRATLARLRAHRPAVRIVELDGAGRTSIIHVAGAAPHKVADISPEALRRMLRGPGN